MRSLDRCSQHARSSTASSLTACSACACVPQDTRQQVPSKKVIDLMALPPSPGPLDILAVTWGNKAKYAAEHGYRLVNATSSFTTSSFTASHPASDRPASWNKLRAVRLLPAGLLDLLAAPRLLPRGYYLRDVHGRLKVDSFPLVCTALTLQAACTPSNAANCLLVHGPWRASAASDAWYPCTELAHQLTSAQSQCATLCDPCVTHCESATGVYATALERVLATKRRQLLRALITSVLTSVLPSLS